MSRPPPRFLFASPLAAVGRGCSLAVAAFLTGAVWSAHGAEIWLLDNLANVGGGIVTVIGAPQIAEVSGKTAAVFDGTRDGLLIDANPVAESPAFTIEVLLRPASDGGVEQRFLHVQDTAGRRALLETRTNGRGGWWLDGFMRTSADPADKGLTLIDPNRVHATGRWYWVALRWDGARLATFVNGVQELEAAKQFSPLGDGKISIGVRQNLVSWFKGAIAEVRFHREALAGERMQRAAE